jgi:CheY-like chemotaxis protein
VGYVRLIHWNADEAELRAEKLRSAGYETVAAPPDRAALQAMQVDPPDAVIIDLSRVPSQGRDMALSIRKYKATRQIPLVFVEGDPLKVERIKVLLPDAAYTTWENIAAALEEAIAHPPAEPVVPRSVMEAYAGTPLPKKLGIRPGSIVYLAGAPADFETTLGDLPPGATLHRHSEEDPDLTLWFTESRAELERGIVEGAKWASKGGLWIIWPKKSSEVESDLSETVVRQIALAAGLVDFKVCSVDETWSGLRFTRRRQTRQ